LPTYLEYLHAIQRVDAVRYFIMLHHCGFHADLDYDRLRPLDDLIGGPSCVLSLEPTVSAQKVARVKIIGNALIAANPGHPMLQVLTWFLEPCFRRVRQNHEEVVLETAGPLMLTNVWHALLNRDLETLVESVHFYPLTMYEADVLRGVRLMHQLPGVDLDCACKRLENAFAIHHHFGTWWRDGL
jgi:mannosyltransferase OCH1-like enzyme